MDTQIGTARTHVKAGDGEDILSFSQQARIELELALAFGPIAGGVPNRKFKPF